MKKIKNYLVAGVAVLTLVCAVSVAQAGTLETLGDAGTVTQDQSVYATPMDRRGIHVVHYTVPATGISGAVNIGTVDLPKGSILLPGFIEVQTALIPATSSNAIAIGGVAILAAGTTLNASGIDEVTGTAGITTAADKMYITVTGDDATGGVFTVYQPYIMGNDQ